MTGPASRAGRAAAGVGLVVALVAAGAGPVRAQEDCQWLAPSGDLVRQGVLSRVTTPHLVCRGGVRIRADSARYYEIRDYYELYDNVYYEDPERILRARRAQYFRRTGRLQAQEDVRLTRRTDNAQITGDNLVYVEAARPGVQDVLTVTGGRPHAVLYISSDTARSTDPATPDTAGGPPAPWEVDADRIEMQGEERFEASGNVEIVRDSLEGFGDRAVYDSGEGRLTLLSRARMVDAGYTLEGDTIDAILPGDVIREIQARNRAVLTGDGLDVRAPTIRMLMTDGALERLVAVTDSAARTPPEDELGGAAPPPLTDAALLQAEHPVRPVARARDFVILADSVDVRLPGEILESLVAVGDAHGESTARDSLANEELPEVARRDWIDGRSIEALFERVEEPGIPPEAPDAPRPDSARGEYRLQSLTARGSARSLYRMAARDTGGAAADTGAVPGDTTAVPDSAAAAVAADSVAAADSAAAAGPASAAGAPRLAIHYVVGDTIVLTMEAGEIRTMDVVGQVRGVHWEPVAPPRRGGATGSGGGPSPPGPGRRGAGPVPPGGRRARPCRRAPGRHPDGRDR